MPNSADPSGPIILYDGVCGLCNRFNRFVLERDAREQFHFAALQSDYARELLTREGGDAESMSTLYVWTGDRLLARSRAVLHVVGQLRGPWRLLTPLGWLPTGLLDLGYRVVSRNRYRFFGRTDACALPEPGWAERFIAPE